MAQLSEEERSVQRRSVATVRSCGVLNSDGLAMWREADCGEWKATAAEIGRDLDMLQVPYQVVTAYRFPHGQRRVLLTRPPGHRHWAVRRLPYGPARQSEKAVRGECAPAVGRAPAAPVPAAVL
ncbi:hypothetical protein O3S80_02765 [Streptomyces sp. Lzd4kr]|nr:hypothetical protein [Streptomyces sp. Lzd4kr]